MYRRIFHRERVKNDFPEVLFHVFCQKYREKYINREFFHESHILSDSKEFCEKKTKKILFA